MRPPVSAADRVHCGDPSICSCFDDGRLKLHVKDGHTTTERPKLEAVHVYVFGLCPGEEIEIQREFYDPCDPLWGPWLTCGKPTVLTCDNPETILTVPGKYRSAKSLEDLDAEHVRIQVTGISLPFAALRLQEKQNCCCN